VQTAQLGEHLLRQPAQLIEADSASRAKRFAGYLWVAAAVQLVKPSWRHLRRRAGLLGMHGSMCARAVRRSSSACQASSTDVDASVLIRRLSVVRHFNAPRSAVSSTVTPLLHSASSSPYNAAQQFLTSRSLLRASSQFSVYSRITNDATIMISDFCVQNERLCLTQHRLDHYLHEAFFCVAYRYCAINTHGDMRTNFARMMYMYVALNEMINYCDQCQEQTPCPAKSISGFLYYIIRLLCSILHWEAFYKHSLNCE